MADLFGETEPRARVVNKRAWKKGGEYIGRPSPLGNPYSHLENTLAAHRCATRQESIDRYERWLRHELGDLTSEATIAFRALQRRYDAGEDLVLICWCAPAPCHGNVIARLLDEGLGRDQPAVAPDPVEEPDTGYLF